MYETKNLIDWAEQRKTARTPYDSQWQEMAKLIRLLRDDFGRTPSPGEKRGGDVYDSTAIYAADNLAAGIFGQMTNPANVWFTMMTDDEDLARYQPVRLWLDIVGRKMLASLSPSASGFYNAVPQLFADFAVFGMGGFYSADVPGDGRFQDVCRSLSEVYCAVNQYDEIDVTDRFLSMNARAIKQKFPNAKLPKAIEDAATNKPDQEFDLLHCVYPNEDYRPRALGPKGKAFCSSYIARDGEVVLEESGYNEFPFQLPRWSVAAGEVYGRGPTLNAMPDIRMLQAMQRTLITMAERQANPAWLAPNEGAISVLRTAPGKVTYGGVDRSGRQLVHALQSGASSPVGLDMIERTRTQVKDAYYFSIMQVVGRTGMTATEFMSVQEERMRLMGPHLGRIESEFLSPFLRRRFGMLYRQGAFPPPPPELAGQVIQVRYESPMAKAQKSSEAVAITRFMQAAEPLAQLDPKILQRIDGDAALRVLQDAFGAPAKILLSDEAYAAKVKAAQQQQQVAGGLAMGEQGANIAGKLAVAAKNAGITLPAAGGQGS